MTRASTSEGFFEPGTLKPTGLGAADPKARYRGHIESKYEKFCTKMVKDKDIKRKSRPNKRKME